MCKYCDKEKAEGRAGKYGVICPRKAGQTTGRIIVKRLKGEPLTENEEGLLAAFCRIASPTVCGVKIADIGDGGIVTKRFGSSNVKDEGRGIPRPSPAAVNGRYHGCTLEYCCECGDATGRAGRGDDSLFTDDGEGPYCAECWDNIPSNARLDGQKDAAR